MSGIVGVYRRRQDPVRPEELDLMLDTIAHRGSDGVNVWCKDSTGLGHRMLWSTPESLLEKLPFSDPSQGTTITADARIDNRQELISALGLEHLSVEKITDSELILKAYHRWGKSCTEKLVGDFAFAIWDNTQQQLFCARDHFGIKPFYYYHQPESGIIFASEIKAIISLPEVDVEINEVRIGDYLSGNLEDTTITSYQNVWRLPPAHTLTIDQDGLQLSCYWSLDPDKEIRFESDSEYAKKFKELFTEAVRCRLRSAFPIGSHLSGGMDSTSVTCIARDLLQQQNIELHTFSNIFDSVPECDEREYINVVIKDGGLTPHFVHADLVGPLSEWSNFFEYADESFIGNWYLVWGLNRASKEIGTRVVLSGFDGDTTVSHGILRLTELARAGKWSTFLDEGIKLANNFGQPAHLILRSYAAEALQDLAKAGKWLSFFAAVNAISADLKLSSSQMVIDFGLKAIVPQWFKLMLPKLRNGRRNRANSFPLVNSDFAQRINLQTRIKELKYDDEPFNVKEDHWRQLNSGFLTFPLEASDIQSAAFSIESRHPFMDKRLVEYCLALPSEQKFKQGWSRFILRQAMKDVIPPEIQWRGGKTNMTPSFQKAMLKYDKSLLEEAMVSNSAEIDSYVDRRKLSEIYSSLIAKNKLKQNTVNTIWESITLYYWLKKQKKEF